MKECIGFSTIYFILNTDDDVWGVWDDDVCQVDPFI